MLCYARHPKAKVYYMVKADWEEQWHLTTQEWVYRLMGYDPEKDDDATE